MSQLCEPTSRCQYIVGTLKYRNTPTHPFREIVCATVIVRITVSASTTTALLEDAELLSPRCVSVITRIGGHFVRLQLACSISLRTLPPVNCRLGANMHKPSCDGYGLSTGPTEGTSSWLPSNRQQQQQPYPALHRSLPSRGVRNATILESEEMYEVLARYITRTCFVLYVACLRAVTTSDRVSLLLWLPMELPHAPWRIILASLVGYFPVNDVST